MKNYAIIGFGGLGRIHLLNLVKIQEKRGDFKLKAICGASPERFKDAIRINIGTADISMIDFAGINFYEDYKELVEKEKIDFAIAVLPTYLHEEVAVYCLKKGIDVFCEKPMAITLDGCDNMIKAAKENNAKLMIGLCLRYNSAYYRLKQYIDSEKFGKVRRAEFSRYSQTPRWTWNNWILNPKLSGGCALDMHIHDTDIVNWYFGMPEAVESTSTSYKTEDESIFTRYHYADKFVTASADWSMTSSYPFEARAIVNFENATAVIQNDILTIYTEDDSILPERSSKDNFMREMEAFIKYEIDDVVPEITDPKSVRNSVRIVMAEIESAKTGNKVEI